MWIATVSGFAGRQRLIIVQDQLSGTGVPPVNHAQDAVRQLCFSDSGVQAI